MKIPSYNNQLLNLAEDLAQRLLPAFDTPTGEQLIIPSDIDNIYACCYSIALWIKKHWYEQNYESVWSYTERKRAAFSWLL